MVVCARNPSTQEAASRVKGQPGFIMNPRPLLQANKKKKGMKDGKREEKEEGMGRDQGEVKNKGDEEK